MICPFLDLLEEAGQCCVYMEGELCGDIETHAGNGDAWCRDCIETAGAAVNALEFYAEIIPEGFVTKNGMTYFVCPTQLMTDGGDLAKNALSIIPGREISLKDMEKL